MGFPVDANILYWKRVMNEKNISCVMLSEMTGIPQPQISRYFNGINMPSFKNKKKIADALGIDYNYMSKLEIEFLIRSNEEEYEDAEEEENFRSFLNSMLHFYATLSQEDRAKLIERGGELEILAIARSANRAMKKAKID